MKMFFSKAKPKAASTNASENRADLEVKINSDLVERRKIVRALPTSEAIEHDDEESWSAWNALAAQQEQDAASASAIAKLHQLLQRKSGD